MHFAGYDLKKENYRSKWVERTIKPLWPFPLYVALNFILFHCFEMSKTIAIVARAIYCSRYFFIFILKPQLKNAELHILLGSDAFSFSFPFR